MRPPLPRYVPLLVALAVALSSAVAGCRATSGQSTPAPASEPASPAPSAPSSPEITASPGGTTAKPGNPTPLATVAPPGGSVLTSDLVEVLAVRCDERGLELASDRVRAARDGVHVLVTGTPGYQVALEHELGGGGVDVEDRPREAVELIPPGVVEVGCGLGTDAWPLPSVNVVVEDPDRIYRSFMIGMAQACTSGSAQYGEDARGGTARPVRQARDGLVGLRAGDVVQRAGYPVETGRVRVVRAGQVIGSLEYVPDGHGGWLQLGATLCEGLGFRG